REERRRRHHIEIDEALAALTSAERQLAELEASLSRFRQEIQKQREPAAPAITDAHIAHITVITPAPTPTPIENPESSSPIPPVPVFSDIPGRISLIRFLPNWEMPVKGLIAGLILGILWSLVRELLTFRLGNANEVGYLAAYPVLSILPGYDAKSLRNAAKSTRGELAVSRSGGAVFTPAPVELFEPQPASRRAKLAMFKRRPRILAWVFGFLILAGGVIMHFSFSSGIAQPEVAFRGELAPPPATAYDLLDPENEDGDWGDEP
ncbi:MAG: hypothetical protein FWG74_10095, partial [Planctomycetes bacterium]|nr:hypothetical protein [Planctomycetota bacterium]